MQVPSNECETVSGHLSGDESIVQLLLPEELVARQYYYSHVELLKGKSKSLVL